MMYSRPSIGAQLLRRNRRFFTSGQKTGRNLHIYVFLNKMRKSAHLLLHHSAYAQFL